MAREKVKLVWVTSNKSFVGGPELGFTLLVNRSYQIPEKNARYFASMKWVEMGKVLRKKENPDRMVLKD